MSLDAPAVTLIDGRPLVTLVVPCHGEGRYLDDCLRSLRAQDHRWLEIIVIDDAGHDDSMAVAAEHALADPRVVVVRLRHNVGLGAVRNVGLRAARGELVGFVDGDDLLPATSVSARVRALAEHLHAPALASVPIAGAYGDWDYVAPAVDEHVPTGRSRELVAVDLAASAGGNVFIVSAPLVRTDVLRATGGFAEAVSGGEDHIAWMRVLATGAVFVPCREVVAHYRQKPISMVRTSVAEYAALTAASRRHLHHETAKADPGGPAELLELAAGEHTISFGVVEDKRPAMAALAPATMAVDPVPDRATSDATPWPADAPVGPPDGSGARARIGFGEVLLRRPEPPRRPDADVIVGRSGALSVIGRPGDVDGPLPCDIPADTDLGAPMITIGASSALGGVTAMAAALVLTGEGATETPVAPVASVAAGPTLILSATARRAALAAAASWGRLPSALTITDKASAPAGAHLEIRDRHRSDVDVTLGMFDAAGEIEGIDAAALLAEVTGAPAVRSGVLVVISRPESGAEAIRALLERATAAASTSASGVAAAPTHAAGHAGAARVLADHGVAVRAASIGDLASATHVVTDDGDIASLAAAVGTAATVMDPDGAVRIVAALPAPPAAGDTASARLVQLVGAWAVEADRDEPSHEKPPSAR